MIQILFCEQMVWTTRKRRENDGSDGPLLRFCKQAYQFPFPKITPRTWLASILVCVADHSCGILKDFLIDVDWINPLSVDYELLARNPIKTPQNVMRLTLRATRMTIVPCPRTTHCLSGTLLSVVKVQTEQQCVVLILSSYNLIMIRCLTGIYFNQ